MRTDYLKLVSDKWKHFS